MRNDCFSYPLLQQYHENKERGVGGQLSIPDINGAVATIFIAGFDTTNTTILVGIIALLLHPAVFKKARGILDGVIGPDRPPSLKDRENPELRYIDFIIKEISAREPKREIK